VDSERYRRFFEPLIRKATADFQQYKESLEEALGKGILPDSLDQYAPEDRPLVVEDIERIAATQLAVDKEERKRLIEENMQLRQLLEEHQERERKRREFVQRQREKQRGPR